MLIVVLFILIRGICTSQDDEKNGDVHDVSLCKPHSSTLLHSDIMGCLQDDAKYNFKQGQPTRSMGKDLVIQQHLEGRKFFF